jgi:hypothetical protein
VVGGRRRLEVVSHSDWKKLDGLNTGPNGTRLLRRGLAPMTLLRSRIFHRRD